MITQEYSTLRTGSLRPHPVPKVIKAIMFLAVLLNVSNAHSAKKSAAKKERGKIHRVGRITKGPGYLNLYRGKGANRWKALSPKNEIVNSDLVRSTKLVLKEHLEDVTLSSIVSLGAGTGDRDEATFEELRATNRKIKYIPADGSFELLRELTTKEDLEGVLGNYETNLPPIIRKAKRLSAKGKMLIAFTGYTFGNIVKSEKQFLEEIRESMAPGDYFLFDYGVSEDVDDPYYDDIIKAGLDAYPSSEKEFIAATQSDQNTPIEDLLYIKKAVDRRIPGKVELQTRSKANEEVVEHFRYYEPEPFNQWLSKQGLEVVEHVIDVDTETNEEFGVVLLRMPTASN